MSRWRRPSSTELQPVANRPVVRGVAEKRRKCRACILAANMISLALRSALLKKKAIIDGRSMTAGDIVIGLASSGIHSNGYSLVRRMIERARPDLNAELDGRSLADALMAPTRIYVKPIRALLERAPIKGIAHITGGGLIENIPRAHPESLCAELDACAWPRPPVFE